MKNNVKTEVTAQARPVSVPVIAPEFRKRIGSTTYVVAVYFSRTSVETLEDKLFRLIESEVREIA